MNRKSFCSYCCSTTKLNSKYVANVCDECYKKDEIYRDVTEREIKRLSKENREIRQEIFELRQAMILCYSNRSPILVEAEERFNKLKS
jgi:hypothetical protein